LIQRHEVLRQRHEGYLPHDFICLSAEHIIRLTKRDSNYLRACGL